VNRILGVDAHPSGAFVALVDGDRIQAVPERIQWPTGEETERLRLQFQDVQAVLRENGIEGVAILLPQRTRRPTGGYFVVADRIALETVVRLAAVMLDVPVVMMDRSTVRSRLHCPKDGQLEDYLDQVIPEPVGQYWRAGRGLAAMAAMAAMAAGRG